MTISIKNNKVIGPQYVSFQVPEEMAGQSCEAIPVRYETYRRNYNGKNMWDVWFASPGLKLHNLSEPIAGKTVLVGRYCGENIYLAVSIKRIGPTGIPYDYMLFVDMSRMEPLSSSLKDYPNWFLQAVKDALIWTKLDEDSQKQIEVGRVICGEEIEIACKHLEITCW